MPYPGSFLQFGHHDDVCAALLPDHPPEITEGLGQRALSGDVSVLLPVAVDVVSVDVIAAWNTCQHTAEHTEKQKLHNGLSSELNLSFFITLLFGC